MTGRKSAIVDAAALCAFVVIGVLDHGGRLSAASVARNLVPLLVAWFGAALALGTYRRGGLRRLFANWALAVPAGIVVRELILGRSFDAAFRIFLAASLASTLALLLAGRALYWGLARIRSRVIR